MTWYGQVEVLGEDTNKPIGAAALAGDGRLALADANGLITWREDVADELPVLLEANDYVNQIFIFRKQTGPREATPVVHLEKNEPREVHVAPPSNLQVVDFFDDTATLEWDNGENYSKVLLRWAVLEPDGQRTNAQQVDLGGHPTTHDVIVPGNSNIVFSVKGGRANGPLAYVYSDWSSEILFPTPARSAFVVQPALQVTPGAPVTALAPWGNGHVDLFVTDSDGVVWSTFWEKGTSWVSWFPIHPEVKMHPGASVSAYAPPWGNHIDLFVTDSDGVVWSTFWEKGTSWVSWFPIHPEITMYPGAPVTALVTHPGHYDVFVTDRNGSVLSTFWEKKTGWVPWFEPRAEVRMQPGARVTALVPWGNDHIDLFVTGTDGAVWSTFWQKDTKWVPWFMIHPEVKMQPGATVSAIAPGGGKVGHIDLFATGTHGEVLWTYWEAKTTWAKWLAIHREVPMQPGATVSVLNTRDEHVDLFVTDRNGVVWSSFRPKTYGPSWVPWFGIHHEVHLSPGAPIASLVPHPEHIDLFAADAKGAVWSMNWQPNTGW
jgi:hypothetical protein